MRRTNHSVEILFGGLLALTALSSAQSSPSLPRGFELVFDSGSNPGSYLFSDPEAWTTPVGVALELVKQSDYRPPHRSPLNIALLEPWLFGSFVLEMEVLQTGREYGHRDACFFFGFEGPERFYYAHLATSPDERAHNVFLVNRAARAATAPVSSAGVDWGLDAWHTVRVERSLENQTIEVYFDGNLTLSSEDTTIAWGRIGVGSFDDTARFRHIRIWAKEVRDADGSPW